MIDRIGAHAPRVRALAHRLVTDQDLAEDLAQDVLVAALERGPRDGGAFPAWLVAVVKHLASKAFRARARRREREGALARGAAGASSPADLLASEEHSRWLTEHVLALDEPVRTVMALRYLEDLPPREVARRLGIPVETVRTRAKRGVALLRERLERRREGDGGVWGLALAGASKLEPAGLLPASRAVLGSPATVLVAMSVKKAVSVALAALVLAWIAWRVLPSGEPAPGAAAASAEALGEPASRSDPVNAVAQEAGERTAIEQPPPEPVTAPAVASEATTGSLLLSVRWHDGTPAAGVNARLYSHAFPDVRRDAVHLLTGSDGTRLVESLSAGRWSVWLDRGRPQACTVARGECATVSITLPRGVDLSGRVVSRGGAAVEGAEVLVDTMGTGWDSFVMARSGADGRFAIRSADEGLCWVWARAALHAPSAQREVMTGEGEMSGIELVLEPTGAALEGVVIGSNGTPVAGAEVLLGPELSLRSLQLEDGSRARVPAAQHAVSDAQGRFSVAGVPIGPIEIQARAKGHAPWRGEVEIDGRAWQEIRLAAPATVSGRVTDDSGKPLRRAIVSGNGDGDFASSSAWSDAEGRYTLSDLPAGDVEVSASAEGFERARTTVLAAPGATLAWDPVLRARPRIRGRLVSSGIDFSKWWIRCEARAADGSPFVADARPAKDGAFDVEACGDVGHELQVHAPGGSLHSVAKVVDVRPGPREIEIAISAELALGGRVRGRVLDGSGRPVAGAVYTVSRRGDTTAPLFAAEADGSFEAAGLVAGRYRIDVHDPRFVRHTTEWIDLAPGATWDFGDLRLQSGGTLHVRLRRDAALAEADANVTAESADSGRSVRLDVSETEARSALVAPGVYVVRLSNGGGVRRIAERTARVTVEAGGVALVELEVQPALHVRLECRPANGAPVSLRALGDAETVLWEGPFDPSSELALPPSILALVATDALGRTGTHDFRSARATPGGVVEIELR